MGVDLEKHAVSAHLSMMHPSRSHLPIQTVQHFRLPTTYSTDRSAVQCRLRPASGTSPNQLDPGTISLRGSSKQTFAPAAPRAMMDFCGAPLVHALVLMAGVSRVPWLVSLSCGRFSPTNPFSSRYLQSRAFIVRQTRYLTLSRPSLTSMSCLSPMDESHLVSVSAPSAKAECSVSQHSQSS